MTGIKKFPIRIAGLTLLLAAAIFLSTCEKMPDYCSDHNPLNPATQFCFDGRAHPRCAGDVYNPLNQMCCDSTKTLLTICNNDSLTPRTVPLGMSCDLHTLTTTAVPANGGTIELNPNLPSYSPGTLVGVTATAAIGYIFQRWEGADTSTNPTVAITMDDDKSLLAIFIPISDTTYSLTIIVNPDTGGTITRNPDDSSYAAGTEVTVTAVAAQGYRFYGWSGALESQNTVGLVTMDNHRTLLATFQRITHMLTIHPNPVTGGTVTPLSGQNHRTDTQIPITASPADGYRFVNWTVMGDSGTLTNADSARTTVTLRTDATVTANFQRISIPQYRLIVNQTSGGGTVIPLSGDVHDSGRVINISATANSDYRFVNWTVTNGTAVFADTNNATTTVILSSNATIYANFQQMSGTFVDSRDDETYRWVRIGSQVWMAENLNYNGQRHGSRVGVCYDNSLNSCAVYGRLYDWAMVMGLPVECNFRRCGNEYDIQEICPAGWRVPTNSEWGDLVSFVGGDSIAGTMLKSTSGWTDRNDGSSGNGTDDFGFSALPGGYLPNGGRDGNTFESLLYYGFWWTSTTGGATTDNEEPVRYRFMSWKDDSGGGNQFGNKVDMKSLRCIMRP
jgi:uncharacterized protein (TIGR02145 family)